MKFSKMKEKAIKYMVEKDEVRLKRLKVIDSTMYIEVMKSIEKDIEKLTGVNMEGTLI